MNLLAIDTATSAAGVALAGTVADRTEAIPWRLAFRRAPAAVTALVDRVGGWGAIDGIVVPAGPGSFTGLRVGAAMALGLAELRGIPLFAPGTLVAVAEAAADPDARRVCAWIDARRGRRYASVCARIRGGGWRETSGPADLEPARLAPFAAGAPIVGLVERPAAGAVAVALATVVAREPERYRVAPADLRLRYVRPGVDR